MDALAALQAEVPPPIYAFSCALAADPEMRPAHAAAAIGLPGKGGELLRDTRTHRVLAALMGEAREAFRDQRRHAIQMLVCMMLADPREAFEPDGRTLRSIHDLPDALAMAVEAIEVRPDGGVKIKFARRLDVLRLFLEVMGDVDSRTLSPTGVQVHFHGIKK